MEKIKLAIKERESKTPNVLRREGTIPATVYGSGKDPQSVQVDAREFGRLAPAAYSHMIELDLNGKVTNAVIRSVQRVSINHKVQSIQFLRVDLKKKLTLTVPIKFIGVSAAAKGGGVLVESFQEVEIECMPNDIPDFIECDLEKLVELEDALHFGDLKLPEHVSVVNPIGEIVVKVTAPRTKDEPAEPVKAAPVAAAPAAPAAADNK
ncbi:MAG: 50S ribosomal protein L25 [Candidatus Obscuribacterales bacterium]|jgi:large subunit ribosomal protein L25|nr:50S ribosomal protein L25 [Candidatus Obscuribacterales bacterium]